MIVLTKFGEEVVRLSLYNIIEPTRQMNIAVVASTKANHNLSLNQALAIAGQNAAVCYMKGTHADNMREPEEASIARALKAVKDGHHSIFDHIKYSFDMIKFPKILAMILNNQKIYDSSEKSARYTQMKDDVSDVERALYDKWLQIFKNRIFSIDPKIDEQKIIKLAQENARYLTSVFTPTELVHTLSIRQINYLRHRVKIFVSARYVNDFIESIKPYMQEFLRLTDFLHIEGLNDGKGCRLAFFDYDEHRDEEFGQSYCIKYSGSWTQIAQGQRHRTTDIRVNFINSSLPSNLRHYLPPMLAGTPYEDLWYIAMDSVDHLHPQGGLVSVVERGKHEDFILKSQERLCYCAQAEIANQTWLNLQRYLEETARNGSNVYDKLEPFDYDLRCAAQYECATKCQHYKKDQRSRLF